MDLRYHYITNLSFALIFSLIISACAASGGTSGNSNGRKVYSVDFDRMKNVVPEAIFASNFNIRQVYGKESNNRMVLIINQKRFVENESVQQNQGEVRIIKIDDKNTRVEIENPEYHFSVPIHNRKDYQRVIFSRIDKELDS